MNQQPITKQHLTSGDLLLVTEMFYSIQGEGPWTGLPCLFIRLAGCNLRCTWCDTDYTSVVRSMSVFRIIDEIAELRETHTFNHIVITGGEPFLQDFSLLVNMLWHADYHIQVETNGTLSIPDFPWHKVTLVCSPKAGKIHRDILQQCKHYKYVIDAKDEASMDGYPLSATQEKGVRPPPVVFKSADDTVWLMPREGNTPQEQLANNATAVDLCKRFGYRLSYRVHTALGIR